MIVKKLGSGDEAFRCRGAVIERLKMSISWRPHAYNSIDVVDMEGAICALQLPFVGEGT